MSLAARIIAFVSNPIWQNLVAIVVMILFLVYVNAFLLFPAIKKAEDDVVKLQNNIAVSTQDLLNLFVQVRFEDLDQVGQQFWLNKQKSVKIEEDAKIFFTSKTDFLAITLVDKQGNTILSLDRSYTNQSSPSASLKNSILFEEAFGKDKKYISPVYFGVSSPTIRIASSIKVDHEPLAMVLGEIDLTLLWKIVRTPSVFDGKVYLVDERGNIIADPDKERSVSGENLKYRNIVNKLVEKQDQVVLDEYTNENKDEVVAHGLRMANTGWGIVVEQNKAKVFQQRDRTILVAQGLAVASLSVIVFLTIGTFRLVRALIKVKDEENVISTERDKLEIVLSGITDAVIAVDLNKKIITFNKAAADLTGYTKDEALNKNLSDFINVYDGVEEILENDYAPVKAEYKEGLVFQKDEVRVVSKRGKEFFVNLMSGKIQEGESVNLGSIITMHDITREKQLEKMKLDFVAIAAHELRTPITSIRGYLSVFISENKDKLNNDQRGLLERANNASQELNALIENLLNVSKIERNSFGINLMEIDWLEFVRQVLNEFADRANEKKLQLILFEPKFKVPAVSADKLKIKEVLNNLLSNAINYTKSGGKVCIWIEQNGDEVITHVGDTGVGIPKSAIPNLFTKFFRVSGPLEKYSKGTGLGLYISKAIVDLHKGKIG